MKASWRIIRKSENEQKVIFESNAKKAKAYFDKMKNHFRAYVTIEEENEVYFKYGDFEFRLLPDFMTFEGNIEFN